MAGSFRHIVRLADGSIVYDEEMQFLETKGDALEAIDELLAMLRYLTDNDPGKMYAAWFFGVPHPGSPHCTFEEFWRDGI